jgi:hypothetical protein
MWQDSSFAAPFSESGAAKLVPVAIREQLPDGDVAY